MEESVLPINMAMAWHGRFMVLAWVFLFPAGILIARFFKITPKQNWPDEIDNRFWWHSHLWLQWAGGIAVLVALMLILSAPDDAHRHGWVHRYLGWLLVSLCVAQFLSGLLRGTIDDHFEMSLRRRVFELFHRNNGYLLLLVSIASVVTGLSTAQAPVWMLPLIVLWWLLYVALFAYLQRRGLYLDSYQAIWGPGMSSATRDQVNRPHEQ